MFVAFCFWSSLLASLDLDREPRLPRSLRLFGAFLSVHVPEDLLLPGNLRAEILHLFVVVHQEHVESGNILAPILARLVLLLLLLEFPSRVL